MKKTSALIIFASLLFTTHFTFADTWPQMQKLLASDGAANDRFGYSVAIDGDYAVVGACTDDDKGNNSSSAYLFGFAPDADLNDDFSVDLTDFAIFAQWWLWETGL
jgi:hypothetical protein